MQDQGAVAVTVLMPVHNAAATLRQAVASVRAQSRGDWELILIDDASTDGSGALAQELAGEDARIRLLTLPQNLGAAAARNHGLAQARGRFIAFLDADDRWHPEKLARQLEFMARTGAALSFTGYSRVAADGRRIAAVQVPESVDHATLLRRNLLGCLTVIYDSRACGRVPMPGLRRQHDFALWLDLTRRFGPARGLNQDLATYRVAPGSLSGSRLAAARDLWRVYRQCEGLSALSALGYFGGYLAFALRHRLVQRPGPEARDRR